MMTVAVFSCAPRYVVTVTVTDWPTVFSHVVPMLPMVVPAFIEMEPPLE